MTLAQHGRMMTNINLLEAIERNLRDLASEIVLEGGDTDEVNMFVRAARHTHNAFESFYERIPYQSSRDISDRKGVEWPQHVQ